MVLWKRLDWPTGAARCRGAWCKIARFIFGLLLGVIIGCSMSLTYSINLQQPVRAGYDCPRAEQTAPVQLKVRVSFIYQLILSCAHQQNHIPMCIYATALSSPFIENYSRVFSGNTWLNLCSVSLFPLEK